MIKAVIFDIGETLVNYNKPLNWSKLYRPALEKMAEETGMFFSEADYQNAIRVLTKYNTRMNPREYEVTSQQIFLEMIQITNQNPDKIEAAKNVFFSFFRNEGIIFKEVETTLKELRSRNIVIGTLSDVAYGMDNRYALEDIERIKKYIRFPYTSNDIGFRKPNPSGLKMLAHEMGVETSQIIFVGDEQKDILCAKNAGSVAILINRSNEIKEYGQDDTIATLAELLDIIDDINVDRNIRL